jgi:hypothetical protein
MPRRSKRLCIASASVEGAAAPSDVGVATQPPEEPEQEDEQELDDEDAAALAHVAATALFTFAPDLPFEPWKGKYRKHRFSHYNMSVGLVQLRIGGVAFQTQSPFLRLQVNIVPVLSISIDVPSDTTELSAGQDPITDLGQYNALSVLPHVPPKSPYGTESGYASEHEFRIENLLILIRGLLIRGLPGLQQQRPLSSVIVRRPGFFFGVTCMRCVCGCMFMLGKHGKHWQDSHAFAAFAISYHAVVVVRH